MPAHVAPEIVPWGLFGHEQRTACAQKPLREIAMAAGKIICNERPGGKRDAFRSFAFEEEGCAMLEGHSLTAKALCFAAQFKGGTG